MRDDHFAVWKDERCGGWLGKVLFPAEAGGLLECLLQGRRVSRQARTMEEVSHSYSSKVHGEEPKRPGNHWLEIVRERMTLRLSFVSDDSLTFKYCKFPNTASLLTEFYQQFL